MRTLVLAALALCFVVGCQPSETPALKAANEAPRLRQLSSEELAQDFDQLTALFKTYYGPYDYKERRLGINIETIQKDLRAKALLSKTDEEFAGYVQQVAASLHDGHVQISVANTASGISAYTIPIVVTPIQNRAIVGWVDESLSKQLRINVGDEVLSVDGTGVFDLLPMALKYRATARAASDQHMILYSLQRPSYMTDLIPTSKFAEVRVRASSGVERIIEIPWTAERYNLEAQKLIPNARLDLSVAFADDLRDAHRMQMGQIDPIFLTPQTQSVYKFVKAYPSDAARRAFGLGDNDKPPIWAALYHHGGKNILLIRQATYSPKDYKSSAYMAAYQALMSEYEPLADVLVLDQTHNPGGSYCADFYDLFARPGDRQAAEYVHADRKWINNLLVDWREEDPAMYGRWDAKQSEAWSMVVEQAYDQGRKLSDVVPLFTSSYYAQKRDFAWSKPMLVLIDELAGSCGDLFPMLVKSNARAKLFGQTTMGLGGNVEEVGVLSDSRIKVRMTRGLFFTYDPSSPPRDADFIENNGATADIPYAHTVEDFRAGFVGYVRAFSDAAVLQ